MVRAQGPTRPGRWALIWAPGGLLAWRKGRRTCPLVKEWWAVTRRLLVLGAGTAGTMIVNKLRRRLAGDEWDITVVDRDDVHHYQPGYLLLPFGTYTADQLTRSRRRQLPDGVDFVIGEVDRVDAPAEHGRADRRPEPGLRLPGRSPPGTSPRPDQTPGMLGDEWRRSIFDFYTLRGRDRPWPRHWRTSTAAGSSCTSPTCRSSARWPRWSSPSWPRPGCASRDCATASSSST